MPILPAHRSVMRLLPLAVLICLLTACGYKGSLYLPEQGKPASVTSQPS